MLILLGLLALVGGFGSLPLICFGLGIFFSLAGDVFLMVSYARFSDRWFLPGLAAFLFAHVSYIVGLNTPLPNVSPVWSLGLAVVLALTAGTHPAAYHCRSAPERPDAAGAPGQFIWDGHHPDAALRPADTQ